MTAGVFVRAATAADAAFLAASARAVGGPVVARRGERVALDGLPTLVAVCDGAPCGFVHLRREPGAVEVVALAATPRRAGAGTALLEAAEAWARGDGAERVWLVTTNDNVDALRFYQRRGYRLVALRPGAVDRERRERKPSIPEVGDHGIPLHDELELEKRL